MASAAQPQPAPAVTPPHFWADLYSFKWSEAKFRLSLISAAAVGACLFAGVLAGHPGGGLVAGGGAFTVGFGANQRIADSRLIPMMAAVLATAVAALAGTLAGHHNYWLVIAASLFAFVYGILTTRHTGLSWVGQQATVALLVASAFPVGPQPAFIRAGLIAAGGVVQVVVTSLGLRLFPNLRKDMITMARALYPRADENQAELRRHLFEIPCALPAISRGACLSYSLRLVLTISIATEVYRRVGMQSGYWIPMTALLVQKPEFFETLTRATARILGTLAGAWVCSILIAHVAPGAPVLALMATVFALLSFATNSVNYGLFAACLTAYIVFLLSLNQIPGPVIAHRRAWCTIAGGLIALAIHIDALRRHRRVSRLSAADVAAPQRAA